MIRIISQREQRVIVEVPDHPLFRNFILGEHVLNQLNPKDVYTIENGQEIFRLMVYGEGLNRSWQIREGVG